AGIVMMTSWVCFPVHSTRRKSGLFSATVAMLKWFMRLRLPLSPAANHAAAGSEGPDPAAGVSAALAGGVVAVVHRRRRQFRSRLGRDTPVLGVTAASRRPAFP